jgi:type I restriction-modification system DNA methylase subunit
VILPFTVLRRLDAVMEPTREAVRARDESLPEIGNKRILLQKAAKLPFYNTSQFDFEKIAAAADHRGQGRARVRERILREHQGDPRAVRLRRHRPPDWRTRSCSTG